MLEARNLFKSFGALQVTNNVSFSLNKGERRVILGPNGAGKTTLFNLLVGEIPATSGDIFLDGQNVTRKKMEARARAGMARSYQKNNLFDELTVRENLALAISVAQKSSSWITRDTLNDANITKAISDIAAQIALTDVLDIEVASASYGIRRQLEVGIALATSPTVLLMDEPTSGVGPEMIKAFHTLLKTLPEALTVLIIEHDMDLALDVADRVTVLNYGEVVFEGTPDETRQSPLVREIYLGGDITDA
jgi:branched-chain amino acid transport system ATP-binding protein